MVLETGNEPYVYEALSNKVHPHPIRLLKILPGEPGSRISCELLPTYLATAETTSDDSDWETISGSAVWEYFGFTDSPRYTALS
jgi:hypothetical protein